MLSEHDRLILDIINDMHGIINEEQMNQLKKSLAVRLGPLRIERQEANIVKRENNSDELIKWFLLTKRAEGCSTKTIRYYKDVLLRLERTVKKPIEKLNAMEIRVFLAMKSQESSESNADNYRRVISSFFSWMTDNDIITKNPMRQIKKIKYQKRQVQPFTQEEIERMRYGVKDIRTRALIELLLSTGCRISEVSALNKDDIDWKNEEVEVLGKGNKKRIVFLNDAAILYLREYLKTRDDDNPALFVDENRPHDRLLISAMGKLLRDLGRELGIKNVHPHRFRHTVATWEAKRGMDIQLVQKMLGHASIETTMIYATVDVDDVRTAHKKFCT